MAGLSKFPSAVESARGRDRGQLLLIGAFGLAVLLLVFAGVLNTVTYTESLATRDSTAHDGRDVAAFQEDARVTTQDLVARANEEDSIYSAKETSVERSVASWSDTTRRYHARDVTATNVTAVGATKGYLIRQNSTDPRSFTNATGANNWTLATGVSNTRLFRMRVDRASLSAGNCSNVTCYTLVVEEESTWNVSLNQSAVVVDGPDTTATCPVQGDSAVDVNVTAGTVDGQNCESLSFLGSLSGYTVRYRNGTNAKGTYRLTVDGNPENGNYDTSPSASPVIYDVSVRVTYRTPRMTYNTTIRVAEGEPDG